MSNKRITRTGINLLLPLVVFLFFTLMVAKTTAQHSNFSGQSLAAGMRYSNTGQSFILNEPMIDSQLNKLVINSTVSIIVTYADAFDLNQLQAIPNSQIVNSYQRISGVSMVLPGDQVTAVTQLPGITGVYADQLQQVEATVTISPTAAAKIDHGALSKGSGTLFASIDTGVWPEHPSLVDLSGITNQTTSAYPCDFGNTTWNSGDTPFICNDKLVGAYSFLETYKALTGLTANEFDSARDDHGHGTHIATAAVGNVDISAMIAGSDMGSFSGMAPEAQLIVYKACGTAGCYASDALAAIEQAIIDDVDVINYAIGGSDDPFNDLISLAFLDAYENDIFVVRAAGNQGPEPNSISESTPWVTTSAASNAADEVASFSARGGDAQELGISKPDIAAQGVSVLAGYSPVSGTSAELFQLMQGTSMSAAQISGAALQIKAEHPDWTPGQIKSAMMLTAVSDTLMQEDGTTPASPFDAGSGQINLEQALDPGLTLITAGDDFIVNQNQLWESNYPSVYVPDMPGGVKVYRTFHSELAENALWRVRVDAPEDVTIKTRRAFAIRPDQEKRMSIHIDASNVPFGEVRHATVILEEMRGERTLVMPVSIVRAEPEIIMENSCNPASFKFLRLATCSITVTNLSTEDTSFTLVDHVPRGLLIVPWGVTGATQDTLFSISHQGTLTGAELENVDVVDASGQTFGYVSLASIGIPPVGPVGDDEIVNFDLLSDVQYGGTAYANVGMVSNGYLVMGGGTAADVSAVNQVFPDTAVPNNVIAPFWTNLNPELGGNLYAAQITDPYGINWMVFEWEDVPNATSGELNTFQVWFGTGADQEIYFVYSDISAGDSGLLTVGAENLDGSFGANWFANGTGTPVTAGMELSVVAVPGAAGESHTATFMVTGWHIGSFTNCAELTSDLFDGTNVACFTGEITR